MSVAKLLKYARELTPAQRKKLVRAMVALDKENHKRQPQRKVKWPDVAERAKQITGGRILPNLVLIEREESD